MFYSLDRFRNAIQKMIGENCVTVHTICYGKRPSRFDFVTFYTSHSFGSGIEIKRIIVFPFYLLQLRFHDLAWFPKSGGADDLGQRGGPQACR